MTYSRINNLAFTGRVLIVDDSEEVQRAFRELLDDSRYELENKVENLLDSILGSTYADERKHSAIEMSFVSQGEEAVDTIKRAHRDGMLFDLVFMDVCMPPGIDGIEAASRIRQFDKEIPLVICSAYSDYGWDEIVEKIGSAERLERAPKPFTRDVIMGILSRYLDPV